MNRNVGILLCVLVLTAAGLIAMITRERNIAAAQLEESRAAHKQLEKELADVRGERDALRKKLQRQTITAGESATAPAAGQPSPGLAAAAGAGTSSPAAGTPPAGAPGAKKGNPFAEMMKAPGMKEMVRQQQIAQLDMQYGKLFSQFHLSDEEKADFKQLLADKLQAEAELGLKMMEDMGAEVRKDLAQQYEDGKKASDARIREFLNNDADYTAFKNWEDTKAERMQLDLGRSLFTNAGEPLTQQQEDQLITLMHQVNKEPSTVPDLSNPRNFDPQHLTQADIDQQLAHFDEKSKAVASRAGQFLSAKQMESLTTMQQQWRTMAETGLKMTSMMINSQNLPAK